MLVLDDVVLFPFKSLLKVFREIYNAAIQEQEQEAEHIRLELSQLYFSLETGVIDEAAFDMRESELLDRLDALEAERATYNAETETDAEDSLDDEDSMDDDEDDTEDDEMDVEPYEYLPSSELES